MKLLEIVHLTKNFFGICALDKVSLEIEPGEIVGLIGPNGSGKTTLFNCATGILPVTSGRIKFKGEDITHLKPHKIALKGISRTFQTIRLFSKMSVLENMILAMQQHQGEHFWRAIFGTPLIKKQEQEARERALELLHFINIPHLQHEMAGSLSYGQQKLLEFAIALMPKPEIVLLDEPAAAVNPTMIQKMMTHIRELNRKGQTFFIVEHNMDVIMELCHRVIVLDYGEKIAEGSPEAIRKNERVIEAYFGS